jgi:hypothetical protein
MKDYFFARVPFFYWILKYNLKTDLPKDLITGLTVNFKQMI